MMPNELPPRRDMSRTMCMVLALATITAMLISNIAAISAWHERLVRTEQSVARVHELEITVSAIKADIARIPRIEDKLDRLLSRKETP
jgi:hypothetical protein